MDQLRHVLVDLGAGALRARPRRRRLPPDLGERQATTVAANVLDRGFMLFSMVDRQREIPCAISTSAMDHLESLARSPPNQREAQFIRLRDRIEERAARKFLAMEFEGAPPGIVLRSIDFQN